MPILNKKDQSQIAVTIEIVNGGPQALGHLYVGFF